MRILIAEDDAACRLILKKSVEKLGHECFAAENGAKAWELFEKVGPDVVVSDWMMPEMSGIDLVQKVRAHVSDAYTYFILLTALNSKDDLLKGLQGGVDDYLVKPIDRKELEGRLISASRVTTLHRQLVEQKMELERLNRELFEDGRRDPLTRIGNRLRMQEDLQLVVARAVRYEHSFALAMCDIDFFKKYNDGCGHGAGDEAIRLVARTLANHSRAGDSAYRYGGEEFLVILPEQSLETAVVALERRRKAVEALAIPHPGKGPAGVVTISAGIAVFGPSDKPDAERLIKRADEALYFAKQAGRNRVATERDLAGGTKAPESGSPILSAVA